MDLHQDWRNEAQLFYELETSLDTKASSKRLAAAGAGLRLLRDAEFLPDEAASFISDVQVFLGSEEVRALARLRAATILASAEVAVRHGPWQRARQLLDFLERGAAGFDPEERARHELVQVRLRLRDGSPDGLERLPDYQERISWLMVAGRHEEVLAATEAGNLDGRERGTEWQLTLAKSITSGDWLPLLRLTTRRGSESTPEQKLRTFVWMTAFGVFDLRARLPLPASVRKSGFILAESPTWLRELYELANALQQFESRKPDAESAAAHLRDLLNNASRFHSFELEMLTLYSVFQLARLAGFKWITGEASRRIGERSSTCSAGASGDILHLLDTDANDPSLLEQRPRLISMGVALSARIVVSRMKQAFTSSDQSRKVREESIAGIARVINDHCQRGHGILQKLIQNAATVDGLVPSDLIERLHPRSVQGRRISPADVVKILDETAPNWRETLTELDTTPFAFGAIGQVHRALGPSGTYSVKVRYPGVESGIRSEFASLKNLSWLMRGIFPEVQWQGLLDHLAKFILNECDYVRERQSQEACRAILESLPGEKVRIPAVEPSVCGARVLVKQWVQGEILEQSMIEAPAADRDAVGRKLMRSIWAMMLNGYFNNDIHPGNYLFDGTDVWMFDFGACVSPVDGDVLYLPKVIRALREGRDDDAIALQQQTGFFPSDAEWSRILDLHRTLYMRPFLVDAEFTFTQEYAAKVAREAVREGRTKRGSLPRKPNLAIVNFFGSFYSMLGRMGTTANWYRLVREVDEHGTSKS
ncbi:MAG: putative ubiquinone biosynthesis protein UbiB [Pseudomonadota bacterium]|jgi:predicted unusual protein kinase regulating ubiquinone biosynthesis (AarF/ABC1/UbiB family)